MKIVIAHNIYQQPGGEDTVVRQESDLLRQSGHQVLTYARSNFDADQYTGIRRLALFAHTTWATDTRKDFSALLKRERPDVVHVHNTFVMISPSIYDCCKEAGIAVVQTLHNYRLFCPASTFLRDGAPCEDCVTGSLYSGVRHRCYRNSAGASAAIATMLYLHRLKGTWKEDIDRYIALTMFARDKFMECGLPARKLTVKPNFVHPDPGRRKRIGGHAVFIGRLTGEKGIETAIEAWRRLPNDIHLKVVGDGPLMDQLRKTVQQGNLTNISLLGRLSREETFKVLAEARFLLFPSEWYESFPMTLLEAFAHGVPVIASDMGAMREIVKHGQTGLLFMPRNPDDLAGAVRTLWNDTGRIETLGNNARSEFEAKYTADENYRQLMDIYTEAMSGREMSMSSAAAH